MIETTKLQSGGYYLFESLSSGLSCYFENEIEIQHFKIFLERYLGKYIRVHKLFFSSEGYQLLLKIRSRDCLIKRYLDDCERRGKMFNREFIEEPWRIISEQIRILHSTYVKKVNKLRCRKGVLVQQRYKRYYFSGEQELNEYMEEMQREKEIEAQSNVRYRVGKVWKEGVDWGRIRRKMFGEGSMAKRFQNHVVSKLVKWTVKAHSSTP